MIPSVLQLSQKFRENNLHFHEHIIKESRKTIRNPRTNITLMEEIFIKPRPIYPLAKIPKFHSYNEYSSALKKSSFIFAYKHYNLSKQCSFV